MKRHAYSKLIYCMLVFVLITIIILVNESSGDTIIVAKDGNGDHENIQDAIDNATAGDTILVWEGTYSENIVVNRTLTIIGNGTGNTSINGQGVDYAVNISANGVSMRGFTITNGKWAGIRVGSDSNYLYNIHCEENIGTGIDIHSSINTTITNCVISNNSWAGISLNSTAPSDDSDVQKITNNSIIDSNPVISGNNVAWAADSEIFFWDGVEITQITDNSYFDYSPQVSGSNVVWVGYVESDYEIFFWDGTTITQVTDNDYHDYEPQISGNNVVWSAYVDGDYEIFFWDGTSISQVTDDDHYNRSPQISGNNITWYGYGGSLGSDNEIFFWDGTSITRITYNNYYDYNPQISGNNIVWHGYLGSDYEIFFWDGSVTTQVTHNEYQDYYPQISGNNVVWQVHDGSDYEIFFWNGTDITQITNNIDQDYNPQISGHNVVWYGTDENDNEIFLWDGSTIVQLTDNDKNDQSPVISGNNIAWTGHDGNDDEIFFWSGVDTPTKNLVTYCSIENNGMYGVYVDDIKGNTEVHSCSISNNGEYGAYNDGTYDADISGNWWGDQSGPGGEGPGIGEEVTDHVDYTPWLHSGTDQSQEPGFQPDLSCIHVDDNSPQTGTAGRIQEGIDMVEGSTVFVHAGTYLGRVVIDKKIDFIGEGMDNTTIDGNGSAYSVWISSNGVNMSNFTVTNGTHGITLQGVNNITIENIDCSENLDIGLYLQNADNNDITGCIVSNNARGIYIFYSNENSITHCDVTDNSDSHGIILSGSNDNTISSCNLLLNEKAGISLWSSNNNIIFSNTISHNTDYGMYLASCTDNNIHNNTLNSITSQWGFFFTDSSSYDNDVKDNKINGYTYYHYYSIQRTAADPLIIENLDLQGHKMSNTGNIFLGLCENVTLRNIKVTNNSASSGDNGKGLYLYSCHNVWLENITASDNYYGVYCNPSTNITFSKINAYSNEVGIYLLDSENCTIDGSTLQDNSDEGVFLNGGNNNVVTDCTISQNWCGIFLQDSRGNTILSCNVSDNSDYGIFFDFSHQNIISSNDISMNNEYGILLDGGSTDNNINNNTLDSGASQWGFFFDDEDSYDNDVNDNIVNGHMYYHYYGIQGTEIDPFVIENLDIQGYKMSNIGNIFLGKCENVTLKNIMVTNNSESSGGDVGKGVYIYSCHNVWAENITASGNYYGIYCNPSTNVSFTNINASSNEYGIYVEGSDHFMVMDCTIRDNAKFGIYLQNADLNTITGCTISGNNMGIYLMNAYFNTITKCDVSGNTNTGVYLHQSDDNKITWNMISHNIGYGIFLSSSNTGNTIRDNTLNSTDSQWGFYFTGTDCYNNEIMDNYVNGYPYYHYYGIKRTEADPLIIENLYAQGHKMSNMGNVFIGDCENITLRNITVANNSEATGKGLYLHSCHNVTVTNVTAWNNKVGIYINPSTHIDLNLVNASGNSYGIWLSGSQNCTIYNSMISENQVYGIYLDESRFNTITGSVITNNDNYGLHFKYYSWKPGSSDNNTIYNNYFDNTRNVYDMGLNTWNISKTMGFNIMGGYNLGGNYWNDYTGDDTDADAIGDTDVPYDTWMTNGADHLPLVEITILEHDIAVTILEAPDSQEIDTTITINATITNFGSSDESNVTIELLVNGVVNQTMIIDLASLSYTTVSFNWTTPKVDGDYELKVSAKTEIIDNRTGNDNRTRSIDVFVITEIEVIDISWSPLDPDDGETVVITATILNNHTLGTTRTIQTTFFLDEVMIYSKATDGLASGESVNLTTTWKGGPGNHTIRVFTDSAYVIRETNETNNNLTVKLNIPFPDLVLTEISYSPEILDDGDIATFSATIENQGSTTLRTFYVGFYIDNTYIGRKRLDGLSKSQVVNVTQVWPASPGNHTIKCIVDYRGEITESNETNNERSLNITGIRSPDLTIINATWTPATFSDGSYVQFNATIMNIGDGNTSRRYYAGFKVDGVCVGKLVITGLDAGETKNYTVTWRATAGLHTLMACVDPDNDVTESNETNNNHTSALPLVPAPDLIVTSVNCSQNDPEDGTLVTFNVTVKNDGTGNTSMYFRVAILVDDEALQILLLEGLDVNESATIVFTKKWIARYGDHDIRAWVDDVNWITESNETNNNLTVVLVVNDTHQPALSSIDPVNNSFVQEAVNITIILSDLYGSGVDLEDCTVKVTHDSTDIPGSAAIIGQTVVFTPDSPLAEGEHEVTIDVIDKEKNSGQIMSYFTIDSRIPEISITGVVNDTTYDHPVTPTIEVTELHISEIIIRVNDQPFTNGTTITSEGTYVLYVKAVDKAGNSNESTIIFRIDKKPSPPTGLHVQRDDTEANISWDQHFESDIQGYNVYRDGEKINDQLVTKLYYLDTDLDENETYVFNVTAVDLQGQESEMAGIYLIGISLIDYGVQVNDEPFLTREFADTITVDIINDDDSQVDIDSVTIEVLNTIGEVTSSETESSFSISASSTYQLEEYLFTGSATSYLRVRVLTGTTEITRIFTMNVRNPPGDPVSLSLPVLLEGYTSLIDIEFTNYGSAPLGVDPSELVIDLWYNDVYILSHGGGLGPEIWIDGQMTETIPGVIVTPMAIGEDIHLEELSLEFGFPTYWGAGGDPGTTYSFSENVSSEYITVPPINLHYDEISKGTYALVNPLFFNHGDANLTVHTGDVTVQIYDENENLLSQGSYNLGNFTIRAGCSRQFPVQVFIPSDAPDQILVRVELKASSDSRTVNTSMARFIRDEVAFTFNLPYNANATTDKTIYQCGDTVMISGVATDVNGTRVPNATLSLSITSRGFTRNPWVTADGNGSYSYLFTPLVNEAGGYQISATHPYAVNKENDTFFEITGLFIEPLPRIHLAPYQKPVNLEMCQNDEEAFRICIWNIGESYLTGINTTIIDLDHEDNVTASLESENFSLAPLESKSIDISIISNETVSQNATFQIIVTSDQGGVINTSLSVKLDPGFPIVIVDPLSIKVGLKQGDLRIEGYIINNSGYDDLKDVVLKGPETSWITIIGDNTFDAIEPKSSRIVEVRIAPPGSLKSGLYQDNITIVSSNYENITIPVYVFVTSMETGNLKFIVYNQFNDIIPFSDISIQNQDVYTFTLTGKSDENGVCIFSDIPSGRYSYRVQGETINALMDSATVVAGTTTEELVIASYSFLKVEWTVEPTTIHDVYQIIQNVTYDTRAPIPYIQMEGLPSNIFMLPGSSYHGNITLTNINEIVSAFNVNPYSSIENDLVSIVFLVENIPELKPLQTVSIPYIIKLAEHHSNRPKTCDELKIATGINADGNCPYGVYNSEGEFQHKGFQATNGTELITTIHPACKQLIKDLALCMAEIALKYFAPEIAVIVKIMTLPLWVMGCFNTVKQCFFDDWHSLLSGAGDCAKGVYSCLGGPYSHCVNAAISTFVCIMDDDYNETIPLNEHCDISPEPKRGGYAGGPSPPHMYYTGPCVLSPETMCVKARVEIVQEQTFEREAFDANLNLFNIIPGYDMTNVSITINITDENGNLSNELFFIKITDLKGLTDIENGEIHASENASISWLFIPIPGAGGPNPEGKLYSVTAMINYTVKGISFTFQTWPEEITVQPMPVLTIDYMLPYKVYGDDPLTQGIIEPIVPFMWGVRLKNSGFGPASNLELESAQPEILDSTKGVHIDFKILGTYVNGEERENSLTIQFGDIQPGSSASAAWEMICSLTGNFTNYTATFTHSDELGGLATSIIQDIQTHVLVHVFINDVNGGDMMLDFLIDTDNDTIPDFIIDSQGNDRSIGNTTAEAEGNPTLEDPTVTLTIDKPEDGEWIYAAIDDPLDNTFNISNVVRKSDGKVLNENNYWLRDGKIHLVDDPSETYTVFYDFESQIEPEITNIMALPDPQEMGDPVNITCLVIDNIEVNVVKVNITMPDGSSVNVTMDGNDHFYNTTYDQLGIYQYYIWANDTDGNNVTSQVQTFSIIETVPPTTLISMGGLKYWNGTQWWVDTDTPFNLSAEDNPDGYGLDVTYYRIWNDSAWGDWVEYTGDFTLPGEGLHHVEYYSLDLGGNIEPLKNRTVRVDATPPSTTIDFGIPYYTDSGEHWITTETPISLLVVEYPEMGSGINETWYKVEDGDWIPYSGAFMISEECNHTIFYYSNDNLGNTEPEKQITVHVDNTSSSSTLEFGGPYFTDGEEHWIMSVTQIYLNATDGPECKSGVNETWYKVEDGNWTDYVDPFSIDDECEHTISYYSSDNLENTEIQKQIMVHVDNTPPITTIEFSDPSYTDGEDLWISTTTLIYLNATDGPECRSGVNETLYKVEDGEWTLYTGPFSIPEECEHTISYYSVDNLGNSEAQKQVSVHVDNSAPTTIIGFSDPIYIQGNKNWITTSTHIYLNATDSPECRSGVNETWYRIEEGEWTLYTGAFTMLGEGYFTISYYSIDNLGNKESDHYNGHIRVDLTAPTTFIYHGAPWVTDGEEIWISEKTKISFDATDGEKSCGLNSTWYRVDDGEWTRHINEYNPFSVPGGCYRKIFYYSIDNLGNAEIVKSLTVHVDISPPSTSISFGQPYNNENSVHWVDQTTSIYLNATDNSMCQSGVKEIRYRIDDGQWELYSGPFTIPDGMGHNISFYSIDNVGNSEEISTLTTRPFKELPDLEIKSANINLSTLDPIEGKDFTIFVEIANAGKEEATDIAVEVYDGTDLVSKVVIESLAGGDATTLEIKHTRLSGPFVISVIIDPDDDIFEFDENNNEASKSFFVNEEDEEEGISNLVYMIISIPIVLGILIVLFFVFFRKPEPTSGPSRTMFPAKEEVKEEMVKDDNMQKDEGESVSKKEEGESMSKKEEGESVSKKDEGESEKKDEIRMDEGESVSEKEVGDGKMDDGSQKDETESETETEKDDIQKDGVESDTGQDNGESENQSPDSAMAKGKEVLDKEVQNE